MKKSIAIVIAAGTLLVAGCCSTHHAAKQWEYKVALTPVGPEGTQPVGIEGREKFLNDLAKDGWILVAAESDLFYLKRPKR
jgi:hypothetical protein